MKVKLPNLRQASRGQSTELGNPDGWGLGKFGRCPPEPEPVQELEGGDFPENIRKPTGVSPHF